MQQKLLRKVLVLAVIIGLTVTAICYVYGFSPPKDLPTAQQQTVRESSKPTSPAHSSGNTAEKAAVQPEAAAKQPAEQTNSQTGSSTPEQVKTEAKVSKEIPPLAAAAKPVPAPAAVTQSLPSTKPAEVSRSASDTYNSNSSYPQVSKVQGAFGQFHYRDAAGGRIEIDPRWIAENIVTIVLPGINRQVEVHKDAANRFITAFNYIKNGTAIINGREVSLLSLVKTMDGTFVTRHVNWNPSGGLSNHSWGIAIDINADDHFGYVDPATDRNDPNLILWEKAFKPAGFSWGNRYSDSMHYELLD